MKLLVVGSSYTDCLKQAFFNKPLQGIDATFEYASILAWLYDPKVTRANKLTNKNDADVLAEFFEPNSVHLTIVVNLKGYDKILLVDCAIFTREVNFWQHHYVFHQQADPNSIPCSSALVKNIDGMYKTKPKSLSSKQVPGLKEKEILFPGNRGMELLKDIKKSNPKTTIFFHPVHLPFEHIHFKDTERTAMAVARKKEWIRHCCREYAGGIIPLFQPEASLDETKTVTLKKFSIDADANNGHLDKDYGELFWKTHENEIRST